MALALMGFFPWAGAAWPQTPRESPGDAEKRGRLKSDLIETTVQVQKIQVELTNIEKEIVDLDKNIRETKSSLDGGRDEVAKILSALMNLKRDSPPVMVTERRDALKAVRSVMLLSSAVPLLQDKAKELAGTLSGLETDMTDRKKKRDELAGKLAEEENKKIRLRGLEAERDKGVKVWQPEREAVEAEIAAIAKNSETHEQLIERGGPVVSRRTGLGDYDKQKDAKNEAPSKDQVVTLAPSGVAAPSQGAARMKPAMPFAEAREKGLLPLPAQGERVLSFGDKTQYGGDSKGTVFKTRAGGLISSPCDGWILYSGEFRSYGQLLIIDAGDGYHVLLAGLSQVSVKSGQFVLAAEPVGTMSNASAQGGQASDPVLYVEFRKDNKPIAPGPWWAVQKVQE